MLVEAVFFLDFWMRLWIIGGNGSRCFKERVCVLAQKKPCQLPSIALCLKNSLRANLQVFKILAWNLCYQGSETKKIVLTEALQKNSVRKELNFSDNTPRRPEARVDYNRFSFHFI